MSCLENYIGIKGQCTTAKLYIDDLPGIDIEKSSNVTNGIYVTPLDLINKCFSQAQKEVIQDLLTSINLTYNKIIDDVSFKYCGIHDFYGDNDEEIVFRIVKNEDQKFVWLHVSRFELISDTSISAVPFTMRDAYGNSETKEIDLIEGFNEIDLEMYSKSEYIEIVFTLSGFKIGMGEYTQTFNPAFYSCSPCQRHNTCGCQCLNMYMYIDGQISVKDIGFNLTARCESNECEIVKYLCPTIDNALLYKTGIHYLLEAKMSGRINAYLRNTEESIENMLALWMGGYDNENGTHIHSLYNRIIKKIASQVEANLRKYFWLVRLLILFLLFECKIVDDDAGNDVEWKT